MVRDIDSIYFQVVLSSTDVEIITIEKGGGALGFSIVGGTNDTSHPFGTDEPGIFICKVSGVVFVCAVKNNQCVTTRTDK